MHAQDGKLDFKLFLKQNIHSTNCLKDHKKLTACLFVLEEMHYFTHKSYFILVPKEDIVHKKLDLSFIGSITGDHRADFKELRIANALLILSRLKQKFQTNFEVLLQKTMIDFWKKEYSKALYLELANDYLQIAFNQYTYFYEKSSWKKRINAQNSYFDKSIGAHFVALGDHLYVSEVLDQSSAEASGLESGDEILALNQKEITSVEDFNDTIAKESVFHFLVRRQVSVFPLSIQKKDLTIPNVSLKVITDNNKKVGILKIRSFMPKKTCQDTYQLILAHKPSSLILDLRGNGGGLVDQAQCVAGIFLGESAMFYEYSPQKKLEKTLTMPQKYVRKMAVLMNAGTASASELLALALVDNDRAILLGEKSFGKGSIIQGQPIDSEYSLMGITGFFTSPKSNYSHQAVGIRPQIELKQNKIVAEQEEEREADIDYFPTIFSREKKDLAEFTF